MADIIQLRRDTAADWTTEDPILADGEMGLETDTLKFKWGDGVTAWSSLDYFGAAGGSDTDTYFNGSTVEGTTFDVTSDGVTVTATFELSGGGDIEIIFNGVESTFDATPTASVALTAGSDTSPQLNYIYILQSTNTLTASTVGFPAAQYAPVGTALVQSAASVQTYGAYKVHAWSDHLKGGNDNGHASHINYWIRQQPATWESGVALTPTVGASTFDVATSSGSVLQLHDHTYPAFDTGSTSDIYVVNDFTTAYNRVGDLTLTSIPDDANGDALGGANTDFYNLVIWGVVNEVEEDCKLMVNVPNGAYPNDNSGQASNDDNNTAIYTIPSDFRGTGFLIARLTVRENAGTYTIIQNEDLRGLFPSTAAGGGVTGDVEFPDNVFRIFDEADETKEIAFDASGITTATTRTITMPDADVDLGLAVISMACSDEETDLETGTAVTTFRMPYAMTLTEVRASVTTAPTGSVLTVDINESGTTILSTKITIDATEKTSETAATPPVISDTALANDAEITIDIDTIGSTVAGAGLKVYLIGTIA